jgi:hypothetical protein
MIKVVGFSYRTTGIQTTPIDEAPTMWSRDGMVRDYDYIIIIFLKKIVLVEKSRNSSKLQ